MSRTQSVIAGSTTVASKIDNASVSGESSNSRNSISKLPKFSVIIEFILIGLKSVTTDSQTSEEDLVPPPLPLKHRDSDYGHISEDSQYSSVKAIRGSSDSYQFAPGDHANNSHYEVLEIRNREVIFPNEAKAVKKSPPTPPPKPARTSKGSFSP